MFKQRLLSGIILVLIIAALFVAGGALLWGAMMVVSLTGVFELRRVFCPHAREGGGFAFSVFTISYAATILYYLLLMVPVFPFGEGTWMLATGFLIVLLAVYVFSYPKYQAYQVMAAFFSFFYVSVMLSYIFLTRELANGIFFVWLIILCSWGSDTCAYCAGVLFGKHKMSPVLSPKKSVEGAVGGVVGAILLTFLFCSVFREQMQLTTGAVLMIAGFAGIGALISMVGDLAASAIKRNYDIKDYGTLIPGHGGILDRFDSVIITAPIIYYLLAHGIRLQ